MFIPNLHEYLRRENDKTVFHPELIPSFRTDKNVLQAQIGPNRSGASQIDQIGVSGPDMSDHLMKRVGVGRLCDRECFPSDRRSSVLPIIHTACSRNIRHTVQIVEQCLRIDLIRLFHNHLLLLVIDHKQERPPFRTQSVHTADGLYAVIESHIRKRSVKPPKASIRRSRKKGHQRRTFSLRVLSISTIRISSSLLESSAKSSPCGPATKLFPQN